TEAELAEMRRDFPSGKFTLRIEEDRFSLKQYNEFLKENATSIDAFRTKQRAAYIAERERWKAEGQENYTTSEIIEDSHAPGDIAVPAGTRAVHTHVTGVVWRLLVNEGQRVDAGDDLAILESMKMEFTVSAPVTGVIRRVLCKAGSKVTARQVLFLIEEE